MRPQKTNEFPGKPPSRWIWLAGIALICAAHVHLLFRAAEQQSVTYDEYGHLPAGVSYWKTGRFEVYAQNPPLMKVLFGGVAVLANVNFPAIPPGEESLRWRIAERFLRANFENYHEIFVFCRLVTSLLSVIGAGLVARWTWRLYGPAAALLATALYASCPNICAHASLVTIDLGATVCILAAAYSFWKFLCFGRWRTLLPAGILMGLAQYCKFTALLLLPVLLLVTLIGLALRAWRRPRRALLGFPVIVLLSLLVVDAGYLFHGVGKRLIDYEFESGLCQSLQRALGGILVPLPYAYVRGFDQQSLENAGEWLAYVHGEMVPQTVWYYYPLAIFVKTPLAFLPLMMLRANRSVADARRRRRRWARRDMYPLAVAILFGVGFARATHLKVGIRYLLPAAPYVYIWLGGLLARRRFPSPQPSPQRGKGTRIPSRLQGQSASTPAPLQKEGRRSDVWLRWAGVLLALAFAVEGQHVNPRYLSFFNLAAGGPTNGYRWFSDSNVDWGQGLIDLRDFMRQRGIQHLQLAYFGTVNPTVYGIKYEPCYGVVTEEWVGVSVYFWSGMAQRLPTPAGPTEFYVSGSVFEDIRAHPSEALVGNTIFIYHFPEFAKRAFPP
jgi:hypothetical protein